MPQPWVGVRRAAIVPVFDRTVDAQPPADWAYQVRSRMYHDPDPATGEDRSFQSFLRALSYGRAFIDGDLFPAVWSDDADVMGAAMRSLPVGHGYQYVVAVLPHAFGQHRNGFAQWDMSPVNGITGVARVALFEDPGFRFRQPVGVWAMEILHMLTEFGDLYFTNPNPGRYDVMASAGATTHASAHTKRHMGWLPPSAIVNHSPTQSLYRLQAIAMPQPGPPGHAAAVRIPSRVSSHHFLVEARTFADQYERSQSPNDGIPREAVVVYEVAGTTDVFLRAELGVGETWTHEPEGLTIRNSARTATGFEATIRRTVSPQCAGLREQIAGLEEDFASETDVFLRRQIRARILQLRQQATRLGCPA